MLAECRLHGCPIILILLVVLASPHHSMSKAIEEVYAALKRSFQGNLLRPDDAEYSNARRIWNGLVARRPAQI